MSEYVVAQAAVLVVPSLDGFQKELQAQLKAMQAAQDSLKVKIEGDTKKLLADYAAAKGWIESQEIEINAKVDTRYLTEIRHKYEDLAREFQKGLILNLKVVGMSLLPQLASGLAAANASMVELTRTAVGLPGLLSGVASVFGSLTVGLGGVKDAFKEYSDAQKNAAQEGLKARNAAINVQNAYRDLGRSIKDAQRNLEDLNAQLRDAPLDEAEAIIRLQEARAEAADQQGKSALQQQKDAIAILKAENDLADTRLRNSRLVQDAAEANAKGVAGADSVREATERLSKATDDAATKQTKLSDSLKELSPNAQDFVKSITGMQSQWTAFRNAVQDNLFAGLGASVVQLAQNDLPILQAGFAAIAGEINGNLKTAMSALQTDSSKGFLENILGNTADAQGQLDKAINPLVDGMLRLSSAGSDYLPRLANALSDVMARFDAFVARADADGSLDAWIESGLEAFTQLGNSLINVGSILNSVAEAFTGAGGKGMVELFEEATGRLADFLKSGEGQDRLVEFFREARAQLAAWQPLLSEIPGLISAVAQVGQQWADMWLPFLTESADLMGKYPAFIGAILQAYLGWKAVGPVIKGISGFLDSDLGTALKNAMGAVGTGYRGGGLTGALGTLAGMISPGGIVMVGLTSVVGFLTYQYVQAQNEAAQEAQAHADALRNLNSQLDGVTGRLTQGGLLDKLRELGNYRNINLTGDPTFNIPQDAEKYLGISRSDLSQALIPGNTAGLQAVMDRAEAVLKEELQKPGNVYSSDKAFQQRLQKADFTLDDLVDALLADPEAVKKYEDGRFGYSLSDLLQGYDTNIPFGLGDKPGLSDRGLAAANTGKAVADNARDSTQVGVDQRANTAAVAGSRVLNQTGKDVFGVLGNPTAFPVPDRPGYVIVNVDTKPEDIAKRFPDLDKNIKANGGGITALADGSQIMLDPDRAKLYVEGYASGGMISGPGTGTSDSILARLSHGEYVVNAASTSKHLPLLEQINSGGLAGFAGGGFIGPWIKSPNKNPPPPPSPSPSSFLDAVKNPTAYTKPTVKPTISGSGSAPVSKPSALSQVGSALGSAVSTVGKGLGVVPGYDQTYTAKLKPNFDVKSDVTFYGPVINTEPKPVAPTRNPLGSAGSVASLYGLDGLPVTAPPGSAPKATPVPPRSSGSTGSGPKWVPGQGFVDSSGKSVPGPGASPAQTSIFYGGAPPKALPAEVGFTGPQSHLTGGMPGPMATRGTIPTGFTPTPIAPTKMDGVIAEVNFGAEEAAKYGLSLTSGLRFTDNGFHSVGQAGDYSNQSQYGPPTPEMNAFATEVIQKYAPYIDELIYSGVPQNIYRGELVPAIDMAGSPYNTGQAGYHGDHVHIAWKPGALQQLQQQALNSGGGFPIIPGLTDSMMSPSNMPMATTPTGVMLPQLGYGTAGGGTAGGLKLPSGEQMAANYLEFVSDAWQDIIGNLVKNAGQIALQFVGSFFGLDFSPILNTVNSLISDGSNGVDALLGSSSDGEGGANLPGDPSVDAILNSVGSLPPEYQNMFNQAAAGQNPQQALATLQQVAAIARQQMAASNVQYNPAGGAEQWRPVVKRVLQERAAIYGITNLKAWEDAMVRQIQTESGGNPNIDNLNDSNGQGGTQAVYGLGQFLPETFAAHNVTGGDLRDPVAQIYAMVDYVAKKYGMDESGAPKQIGRGVGYASGGRISGPGNGRSDSIIARVSNGEYIVRAAAAQKHLGLLEAINSGGLPGYADGGVVNPLWPVPPPPPVTPPPPPPPPPAAAPPAPGGVDGQPVAGAPPQDQQPVDPAAAAMEQVGQALGGVGASISGASGAAAPEGGTAEGDPRAVLGAAPTNLDHNKPAVSAGIQAAGSAISSAINTAVSAASMGANAAAPGAGQALGAASSMISGLVNAGTTAASGAVNILSSLMVGTLSGGGSTAGAYGAPLTPQAQGKQPFGGGVVNNWGGVTTSNPEEFYRIQQRRELQNASPMLPRR